MCFFFLFSIIIRRLVHSPELHGQPFLRQLRAYREGFVLQSSVLQKVLLRIVHASRPVAGQQRPPVQLSVHQEHDKTVQKGSSQQTPVIDRVLSREKNGKTMKK